MKTYEEIKNNFLEHIKTDELLKNDAKEIHVAIAFGEEKHKVQLRKFNKDPYFIHCLRVATNLLIETDRDKDLIIAALLHDTVEDTETTIEEIDEKFGEGVKILVKGMTKVPGKFKKEWGAERYYNEGFIGRLIDAAKKDARVWKIKLSDRTDNMADYHKWQGKNKIKSYVWEAEQFLNHVEEFKVTTPLVETLKEKLKEYYPLID